MRVTVAYSAQMLNWLI